MSGIEVAGLVLGAFPLVISGLKFYLEGISTITRYARYKEGIKNLLMAIECEHRILQNTCEKLLGGILPSEEIKRLLDDPSGSSWKRTEIQTALKTRLREDLAIYVNTLGEISKTIGKVCEKMRLNDDGNVQFADIGRFRQEYERIKFSIRKKDYDELTQHIRNTVKKLCVLTDQSISLERSRRIRSGPKLQLFRNCARSIHSLLADSWKCTCRTDHAMSLSLTTSSPTDNLGATADDTAGPRFIVVFSSSQGNTTNTALWHTVETDLRSFDTLASFSNNPPTWTYSYPNVKRGVYSGPKEQPIENLCEVLGKTSAQHQPPYLGYLLDQNSHLTHSVHTADKQPSSWYTISLKEVLDEKKRFSRSQRLQLAAELSLSVLRYAQTPWLQNQLNKDDITFVVEQGQIRFERPFVCTALSTSFLHRIDTYRPAGIENESLFTLGIMLIELWAGLTIDEICLQQRIGQVYIQPSASTNASIDWAEMEKLFMYLEDEAGELYCVIVKVCIRCEIPGSKKDFEAGAFQDAVFSNVVYPLWKL